MKRHKDLHLVAVVCRLRPGDNDTCAAAKQWTDVFGVQRSNKRGEIAFTNANITFVPGEQEKDEGIVEIVIGVEGEEQLSRIQEKAKEEGVEIDEHDCLEMLGVRWRLQSVGGIVGTAKSRI